MLLSLNRGYAQRFTSQSRSSRPAPLRAPKGFRILKSSSMGKAPSVSSPARDGEEGALYIRTFSQDDKEWSPTPRVARLLEQWPERQPCGAMEAGSRVVDEDVRLSDSITMQGTNEKGMVTMLSRGIGLQASSWSIHTVLGARLKTPIPTQAPHLPPYQPPSYPPRVYPVARVPRAPSAN